MTKAFVENGFYISLFVGMPLGVALTILWGRIIFKPLMKGVNSQPVIDLAGISFRAFVYMLPGLLVLILCCAPALYFGNLRKQREYCLRVVKTNKGVTRDDERLLERCGCYDLDELFKESGVETE